MFDVLVGCLALIQVLSLFPSHVHLQKSHFELGLLISALPFSVMGLLGGASVHRAKLDIYSAFKRLEFAVILGLCVWETSLHLNSSWETACSFLFFAGLRLAVDFYGTYVAWSSSIRLRHYGTLEPESEIKVETSELADVTIDEFLSRKAVSV